MNNNRYRKPGQKVANQNKNRNNKSRSNNNKNLSTINPKLLVKDAVIRETVEYIANQRYAEMNLSNVIKKNIAYKGYEYPTEIQEKAIDSLIEGRNMIGVADTGTGKTAAFLIPIIEHMLLDKNKSALIVLPTRELAMQVEEEFRSLTRGLSLSSSCFIGGRSVNTDMSKARRKVNLIVGTPGRLNDLADRRALQFNRISTLVLDEFDRMLDMGFINDIKKIISLLKNRKQTMLFSATLDVSQKQLINEIVKNPVKIISSGNGTKSSDNVQQDIIKVQSNENKFNVLCQMIEDDSFEKVLIFAETKRAVDKLNKQLKKSGMSSDVIHGNKSQNYRTKAIDLFKKGKTDILIATDVVARGIDIDGITHVINYQLPRTMESYIHRIGRTGRAGKKGMAYTFIN